MIDRHQASLTRKDSGVAINVTHDLLYYPSFNGDGDAYARATNEVERGKVQVSE